eukprot:SAG31_NODE_2240_length_6111_cov_11.710246_6_plen_52_part_00
MEMANNLKSRAEVKEELGIFLDDKAEIFVLWFELTRLFSLAFGRDHFHTVK